VKEFWGKKRARGDRVQRGGGQGGFLHEATKRGAAVKVGGREMIFVNRQSNTNGERRPEMGHCTANRLITLKLSQKDFEEVGDGG